MSQSWSFNQQKIYQDKEFIQNYNIGCFYDQKSQENLMVNKDQRPTLSQKYKIYTQFSTIQGDEVQIKDSKIISKRAINKINCSKNTEIKYIRTVSGTKDQTVQLNINFKTIICKFFKDKIIMKQLNSDSIRRVAQFKNRTPSFYSLKLLFSELSKEDQIIDSFYNFLTSSLIVEVILKSQANITNKLIMLKFLEVLRKNIKSKETIKWKYINKILQETH